jgi:hypothetical protein
MLAGELVVRIDRAKHSIGYCIDARNLNTLSIGGFVYLVVTFLIVSAYAQYWQHS